MLSMTVRIAALLALLGPVAGCADTTKFAPPCPVPRILGDAADISDYRLTAAGQPGRDVTDMVFGGRIIGIAGSCSAGPRNTVQATVKVGLQFVRGPAAAARTAHAVYLVAVTKDDTVLDEQAYPVDVEFPPNTDNVTVASPDINLILPTPKGTTGASYSVFASFRLTHEELAANRSRHAP